MPLLVHPFRRAFIQLLINVKVALVKFAGSQTPTGLGGQLFPHFLINIHPFFDTNFNWFLHSLFFIRNAAKYQLVGTFLDLDSRSLISFLIFSLRKTSRSLYIKSCYKIPCKVGENCNYSNSALCQWANHFVPKREVTQFNCAIFSKN